MVSPSQDEASDKAIEKMDFETRRRLFTLNPRHTLTPLFFAEVKEVTTTVVTAAMIKKKTTTMKLKKRWI